MSKKPLPHQTKIAFPEPQLKPVVKAKHIAIVRDIVYHAQPENSVFRGSVLSVLKVGNNGYWAKGPDGGKMFVLFEECEVYEC